MRAAMIKDPSDGVCTNLTAMSRLSSRYFAVFRRLLHCRRQLFCRRLRTTAIAINNMIWNITANASVAQDFARSLSGLKPLVLFMLVHRVQ